MAGVYLHIPFCKQQCNYCNFHFSTSLKGREEMLQAMHREIGLQRDYLEAEPIGTIYIGGGTPSLLTADEVNSLIDAIARYHPVDRLQEITLEANPDDLTMPYLRALKSTPVNRFSIGIQSFRDEDLTYMNRAHNASQADYAIKAAQDMGYTNLTIDLIYGTPGLSDTGWKANLHKLKELDLPHFSAYALTVEEGTVLHHQIQKKKTRPVDPEQAAAQAEILMEEAGAMGYEQYEISNFARPGCYAIHNTNYWRGVKYLGIGPSAHSFNGASRKWNVANNALYTRNLLDKGLLMDEEETLLAEDRLNEYIMTSLRTMWGLDLSYVSKQWGGAYRDMIVKGIERYQEQGMVERKDDLLTLTRKGKLFADGIAGHLFASSSDK
jgi:oxygen-independent coproporphyrinogen-3 oxidase